MSTAPRRELDQTRAWLERFVATVKLPEGATLTVLDRKGLNVVLVAARVQLGSGRPRTA